jgi:hypothetical protein
MPKMIGFEATATTKFPMDLSEIIYGKRNPHHLLPTEYPPSEDV